MNHNDEVSTSEEKMADSANTYAFEQRKQSIVEELKWRYENEYHVPGDSIKTYAYKVLSRGALTPEQVAQILEALEPAPVIVSRPWRDAPAFQRR